MNLPNLPTDNLYKFAAISGLLLLLISLFGPLFFYHQLRLQSIKVGTEIEILKLRHHRIAKEFSIQRKSNIVIPSEEMERIMIEIHGKVEEVNFLKKTLSSLLELSVITSILGLCISSLGFYKWYYRIQRFQDLIIKNDATKNQLPLEKTLD